jgi:site-specific DNA-methyltransferase (adenine-specific)
MNLDGATRFHRTSRRLRFRPRSPTLDARARADARDLFNKTGRGVYQGDCLELLKSIRDEAVHTLFADPPFNLKKYYGVKGADDLPETQYLNWSKQWIAESVRVLATGGALFIYNLPKWLIEYGGFLNSLPSMKFKHWIAIDKAHSLPIPNRLSPSHYGML